MSYTYPQEYLQQMQAMREAQTLSEGASKLNTVVMDYPNTGALINQIESIPDYNGTAWYYKATRNAAGEVVGVDYMKIPTSVDNPLAVIDSNVANPVFSDYTFDGTVNSAFGSKYVNCNVSAGGTGANTFSNGAKSVATGNSIKSVAGKVSLGIGAVMLGTYLGKKISSDFYEAGAGWQYNPDNWSSILAGDELDNVDKACLRLLLGLNDDDSATPYLDENALASMYKMLYDMGVYNPAGAPIAEYEGSTAQFPNPNITSVVVTKGYTAINGSNHYVYTADNNAVDYMSKNPWGNIIDSEWVCDRPFNLYQNGSLYAHSTGPINTYNGTPYYYISRSDNGAWQFIGANINNPAVGSRQAGTIIIDGTITEPSAVPGVSDDDRATTQVDPNVITGTTPQTILPQLKQNYPQYWNDAIYEDVPQDDGTNKRITYVPVPWIDSSVVNKPTTGGGSQTVLKVDPTNYSLPDLDNFVDLITGIKSPNLNPPTDNTAPTNPPPSGGGNSPITTLPSGSASSLWAVYNPTQAEVNAFGAWLWSSDLVEQIKKLFNDPMQAIIGIHKVFVTPDTSGTQTIKCGYIDSQVSSKVVSSQYKTVNCGTVKLKEYFGNVFDYAPYTEVHLYLPFIGIVQLDVADVMRASITVKYHVDVITGACLVDVIVKRDDAGGVLYQYSGSAIVTYPLSSGSYASALAGVLSVVGGAVATFATKGIAPAITGAIVGGSKLHSDVQKSGTFTGAAGAMGSKKPYLIVSRPQIALADNYKHFTGYPANENVKLEECYGYTKVKSVYVRNISKATDAEKDMIEAQLKAGVLIYLED